MKRVVIISLRSMLGLAVILITMLAASNTSLAQDAVAFDVKAASGSDGLANEYPINCIINYDNGTSQSIAVGTDGTTNYVAPPGATEPISIVVGGVFAAIPRGVVNWHFCFPQNPQGGCWCLCLTWRRVWWWPPIWRPRFFWYYNPCC